MTERSQWRTSLWFVLINGLVWWLAIVIGRPALDGYHDMLEVYAWSQHLLAGSDKHPQVLPWAAHLWFAAMPRSVESFYLLSAVNLTIGMLGIRALGRALGMTPRAVLLALALQALALPYLNLAAKLNMNAVLLALWPWLAFAVQKLTLAHGRARLGWAAVAGVLAAAAIMGKYYSVVLLLSLMAALLMPRLRPIWRSAAPLVFAAALLGALSPHLVWLTDNLGALRYAASQTGEGGGGVDWRHLAGFALTPVLYWPIPMLLALGWLYQGSPFERLRAALALRAGDEVLWFCAVGPLAVSAGIALTGAVAMSQPWAIPIGFAWTLLLVRNRTRTFSGIEGLPWAFRFIWPGLATLSIVFAAVSALRSTPSYYSADRATSETVFTTWHDRHPEGPALAWSAAGPNGARLAFFDPAEPPIEALPRLPDALPSYYPPREGWQKEAGAVVCGFRPARSAPTEAEKDCLRVTLDWAAAKGLRAEGFDVQAAREGWRFPRPVPFAATGVFVWP